ncbi:MAG TPA: tetratricopeptide repeat protein, partial [Streptosporangiaceae bacterium]|nr:tetratricopeptide repeat protein [Streptosporangiaceae bacterium]
MEFRLLGPVEVWVGGELVDAGPARQRCVLAALAADAGQSVPVEVLQDRVWGGMPPPQARRALYVYVTRVRRLVELACAGPGEGARLVRRSGGYALDIDPDWVDLHRFRRLARQGRDRANLPARRAALLAQAVGLWRGDALGNLAGEWPDRVRQGWQQEYIDAVAAWAQATLHSGEPGLAVGLVTELTERYPLNESLAATLMQVLHAAGRGADALSHYARTRTRLNEQLGADPAAELQAVHQAILRGEPIAPHAQLVVPHEEPTPAHNDPATQQSPPPPVPARPATDAPNQQIADAAAAVSLVTAPSPVQVVPEVRYCLPPDAAAFTGRSGELDQITAAAGVGGVVAVAAIDGMPGAGKTALAVHAAHLLREEFPDRQLFVNLHAHTPGQEPVRPEDALAGLLSATGANPRYLPGGLDGRAAMWRDRMAGQRALVVLDNAASSAQVAPLLPGAGGCLVLVTSRRHLGDLPGAAVPVLLDALPADQAAEMFTRLAPRAAVDPAGVAEVVGLAGFLPLAVSLLARVFARHRSWTLADLAAETRAGLLTLTAEHNSIAAAFEVSYQHLDPAQQRFFCLLGLHPATTTDAHAAAALAGTSPAQATGLLDGLHAEGLLTETSHRRYGMHDLLHRYARDHAADLTGESQQALERLLDYYQYTADHAQNLLARQTRPGPPPATPAPPPAAPALDDATQALAWARAERDSLLACLDHTTHTGQHTRVTALTAALAELLQRDGPWADAITRHTTALQSARHLGDRLGQANALNNLGTARRMTGDYPGAAQNLEQALAIYRDLGQRLGQANALHNLGYVRQLTGDYPGAADDLEQALAIYRDLSDRLGQANALHCLGTVRYLTGNYPGAAGNLEQALAIYRDLGDRGGEATALNETGTLHRISGEPAEAKAHHQRALELARAIGNAWDEAHALVGLGRCAEVVGHTTRAKALLRQAHV